MRWFRVETPDGIELINLPWYSRIKADPDNPTTKTLAFNSIGDVVTIVSPIESVTAAMTPVLNAGDFLGTPL